jgi:hypothetical protein
MGQCKHDNIVPFRGVSTVLMLGFCLVFPWYENGNIVDFLVRNRSVDRYNLVSILSQPHALGSY